MANGKAFGEREGGWVRELIMHEMPHLLFFFFFFPFHSLKSGTQEMRIVLFPLSL